MSYNRSYASIVFVLIVVHLIVCDQELDGQTTEGSVDEEEYERNTTADFRVQDESLRRSLFSSLSVPSFMQSESKKKSLKRKRLKKIRYKDEEEDEEEDADQGEGDEQDEEGEDGQEEDDQREQIRGEEEDDEEENMRAKVKLFKKLRPMRVNNEKNVKYVPIPVYMNTPKKEITLPPAISPYQSHMYSMNSMPFDGMKALQSMMMNMLKSNSYYGSTDDDGYGYMPMSAAQGIGQYNFHGLGAGYESMYDMNKKPEIAISDPNDSGYDAYYPGAGYVTEAPTKDHCCDKKTEQVDYYPNQPKFSDYKTSKEYGESSSSTEDDLDGYYGKNGPPSDIMTIIANLNKKNKKKKSREERRRQKTVVTGDDMMEPTRYDSKGDDSKEDDSKEDDSKGDDSEEEVSDSTPRKGKHLSKAKQIAQMLEMLDKMNK